MPAGGIRSGAGRPKGITKAERDKLFRDYWSEEDRRVYHETIKKQYKVHPGLAAFIGEQLWGKASQALTIQSDHRVTIEFQVKDHLADTLPSAGRDIVEQEEVHSLGGGQKVG